MTNKPKYIHRRKDNKFTKWSWWNWELNVAHCVLFCAFNSWFSVFHIYEWTCLLIFTLVYYWQSQHFGLWGIKWFLILTMCRVLFFIMSIYQEPENQAIPSFLNLLRLPMLCSCNRILFIKLGILIPEQHTWSFPSVKSKTKNDYICL